MRHFSTRLALFAGSVSLALSGVAPAMAQDDSGPPLLDPADTGYTVKIGFPSGSRTDPASSPADIWAQHLGLFDEAFGAADIQLEWEPFLGAGPAINEALIAGSLDIANYADTAGILGRTAGADTSLVAIDNPLTEVWLVVPANSDIQTVADLEGRSVATIKATLPHRFLLTVLEANGLSVDDIEFINMSLPDSEAALDAGQIDAAVTLGNGAPRLFDRGYRPIASTVEYPDAAGISVFAATNPFLAAHPSFFPVYLAIRDQAVAWAVSEPRGGLPGPRRCPAADPGTGEGPAADVRLHVRHQPGDPRAHPEHRRLPCGPGPRARAARPRGVGERRDRGDRDGVIARGGAPRTLARGAETHAAGGM